MHSLEKAEAAYWGLIWVEPPSPTTEVLHYQAQKLERVRRDQFGPFVLECQRYGWFDVEREVWMDGRHMVLSVRRWP